MSFEIRELRLEDYDAALALWQRCPGIGLSNADSLYALKKFLQRNPGLSFVAFTGDELVGTVLSGHDGRRGFLYHLAVDPRQRRQGLGRALAERALSALKAEGIQKCHILVYRDNEDGKAFWQSFGWKMRSEIDLLSYDIDVSGKESPC